MISQEDVARAALAEISPAGTVGELLETAAQEDGTATLRFASTLSGYPGWHWSVSVAEVAGEEPTVMEAELMPGEGALIAPERLEDYRAAQAVIAAETAAAGDDEDDLADERDDDDDLGDDPDDGIDFEDLDDDELGMPLGRIDEQDEAEAESDDDGPEQPEQA
jgi:hypothetical protein